MICRPTLPITFQYGGMTIPVKDALVDTGADQTLLPLAFEVEFGFRFDLKRDGIEWSGAGGGKFRVFLAPEPIEFILEQRGFRRIHTTSRSKRYEPLEDRACISWLEWTLRGTRGCC